MLLSCETCGSAASTGVGVVAARPPRMWCTVLRLGRRLVSSPLVMLCLLYLRLSRETCGSTSNVLRSQCICLKASSVDLALHIQTRSFSCARRCSTCDVTSQSSRREVVRDLPSRLGPHQGSIERANIERLGRVWFHISKRPSRTNRRSQQCLTVRT